MVCIHRRYIAKVLNTFLLTMGGYSFGAELGRFAGAHDLVLAFSTASLFCAYSFWMRKICECPKQR